VVEPALKPPSFTNEETEKISALLLNQRAKADQLSQVGQPIQVDGVVTVEDYKYVVEHKLALGGGSP